MLYRTASASSTSACCPSSPPPSPPTSQHQQQQQQLLAQSPSLLAAVGSAIRHAWDSSTSTLFDAAAAGSTSPPTSPPFAPAPSRIDFAVEYDTDTDTDSDSAARAPLPSSTSCLDADWPLPTPLEFQLSPPRPEALSESDSESEQQQQQQQPRRYTNQAEPKQQQAIEVEPETEQRSPPARQRQPSFEQPQQQPSPSPSSPPPAQQLGFEQSSRSWLTSPPGIRSVSSRLSISLHKAHSSESLFSLLQERQQQQALPLPLPALRHETVDTSSISSPPRRLASSGSSPLLTSPARPPRTTTDALGSLSDSSPAQQAAAPLLTSASTTPEQSSQQQQATKHQVTDTLLHIHYAPESEPSSLGTSFELSTSPPVAAPFAAAPLRAHRRRAPSSSEIRSSRRRGELESDPAAAVPPRPFKYLTSGIERSSNPLPKLGKKAEAKLRALTITMQASGHSRSRSDFDVASLALSMQSAPTSSASSASATPSPLSFSQGHPASASASASASSSAVSSPYSLPSFSSFSAASLLPAALTSQSTNAPAAAAPQNLDFVVIEPEVYVGWQCSAVVSACTQCKVLFKVHLRKHHCRSCGELFCSYCSAKRLPLPHKEIANDFKGRVRVCTACFDQLSLVVAPEATAAPAPSSPNPPPQPPLSSPRDTTTTKLLILGPKGVGKSRLVHHFLASCEFDTLTNNTETAVVPSQSLPTPTFGYVSSLLIDWPRLILVVSCSVSVHRTKVPVSTESEPVSLDLWDMSGDERYHFMLGATLAGAQACVLVYDIHSKVRSNSSSSSSSSRLAACRLTRARGRVQNGLESLEPFTNALSKYRSIEEAPTQDEVAVLNWRRELVVVLVGLDTRPSSTASTTSSSSAANFAADKEAIAAFAGRFSTSHICSKPCPYLVALIRVVRVSVVSAEIELVSECTLQDSRSIVATFCSVTERIMARRMQFDG